MGERKKKKKGTQHSEARLGELLRKKWASKSNGWPVY
jgi:hypothetical protein